MTSAEHEALDKAIVKELDAMLSSVDRYDWSDDGMRENTEGHWVEHQRLPWAIVCAIGRAKKALDSTANRG